MDSMNSTRSFYSNSQASHQTNSQNATQTNARRQKVKSVEPARWDKRTTEIFITLCAEEILLPRGHSWTPSVGLIPPEMQEGADDEDDNVEQEIEPTINHETPIAGGIEFGGVGGGSQRKTNLIHSRTTGEKIAQSMNDMVGMLREREIGRHAHMPQKYTISECMEVLYKIDGIEEGDGLWVFASNLFLKPSVRELWLSMRKDEVRLIWLRDTMENYMEKRASSMFFQGSRGDTRDDTYSS